MVGRPIRYALATWHAAQCLQLAPRWLSRALASRLRPLLSLALRCRDESCDGAVGRGVETVAITFFARLLASFVLFRVLPPLTSYSEGYGGGVNGFY